MEIRRRIRKYRYKLILLCFGSILCGQAEYQLLTIPNTAFSLSMHNGFGAISKNTNYNKKYNFSYLQFPSQINLLNLKYKKIHFIILDYGILEDKVDNLVNNRFHSFEGLINYNYNKNIFQLFNLNASFGSLYSKIGIYKSLKDISRKWKIDRNFTPKMKSKNRLELLQGWSKAIKKTLSH